MAKKWADRRQKMVDPMDDILGQIEEQGDPRRTEIKDDGEGEVREVLCVDPGGGLSGTRPLSRPDPLDKGWTAHSIKSRTGVFHCPVCGTEFERPLSQSSVERRGAHHPTTCSRACANSIKRHAGKTYSDMKEIIEAYEALPSGPSGLRKAKGTVAELAKKFWISTATLTNYVRRYSDRAPVLRHEPKKETPNASTIRNEPAPEGRENPGDLSDDDGGSEHRGGVVPGGGTERSYPYRR